jgi:CRP-like cAMP-binding protein
MSPNLSPTVTSLVPERKNAVKTPSDYQAELDKCSLLSGFTKDELAAFLDRVRFEDFGPGDEILTEGKQYQGVWLLLKGTCEVVKHGRQRDSRLAVFEPGNVFGEMSFLQAVPHSASVRAIDQVETLRLMRDQYGELREHCPSAAHKIAINLIRVLADRLRKMDEWTCELVERDGSGRRVKEWQDFRSKLYTSLFE